MNILTIGQLLNQDKPTVYYDTKRNNIKLSLVPTQTMLNNNCFEINLTDTISNKPKKSQNIKTNNKTYYTNKNKKVKNKTEYPDKLRCCAITNGGNRCCLKRYTLKTEYICYIHYNQQLKSTIKDNHMETFEQEQDNISITNKLCSWFTKILFSNK